MAADALNNRLKSIEKTMQAMSNNTANINSAMQGLTSKFQSLGNKIVKTNDELKKTASILQDISMKLDGMGDPLGGTSSKQSTKDYIDMIEKIGKIRVKNEETISSNRAKWKKISLSREDELIKGRRLQEVMSRANLPLLGLITEQATMRSQDVSGRMSRVGELRDKSGVLGSGLTKEELREMLDLQAIIDKGGFFQKFNDMFEKNFGKGSAWDKAFAGHGKVAAGGIAMGGVGAAMGLSKKIIDSSPLMQQMLKIINFGFVLLLRPIGDFFGMILRPIVLLLLRKFIIPFYQTVYPWFLKNGKIIGDTIAGIMESGADVGKIIVESVKVAASDITGAIKNPTEATKKVHELLPDGKVIRTDKINPLAKVLAKIIPKTGVTTAAAGLAGMGLGTAPKEHPRIIKAAEVMQKAAVKALQVVELPAKALVKTAAGAIKLNTAISTASVNLATAGQGGKVMADAGKKITAPLKKVAENAAVKAVGKTASRFIPVVGQALLAIDALGSTIQAISPETYTGINTGIRAGGAALGIPDWLTEGALDFVGFGEQSTLQQVGGVLNTLTGGAVGGNNLRGAKNKMATGGIINEPIFGVGQSGRTYSFGERGAEAVTPLGQGTGTTVNVTVNGSIYSDKDMLNFQRTIMRAIETSNTRRAKI